MTMFSQPNLGLARRFLSGGPPAQRNAARYPNMGGFSRSPAGQEMMARVLQNMQGRKRRPGAGMGRRPMPRGRPTPSYVNRRP